MGRTASQTVIQDSEVKCPSCGNTNFRKLVFEWDWRRDCTRFQCLAERPYLPIAGPMRTEECGTCWTLRGSLQ